ncbi:hypothetical protein [Amycolatopsis sp. CA-230715]|uniref:hypothetical protein n=1 Tax=Amycolatopsis sp. CA-230715 TaxID=2745196 RepID=UPI001C02F571|nr:hypothetical protein [Amycolatopsis sp. CA-230715]QWF85897.1 hypothetical protein HUW46_09377 [Amycolatopsis sp. CA-230715]
MIEELKAALADLDATICEIGRDISAPINDERMQIVYAKAQAIGDTGAVNDVVQGVEQARELVAQAMRVLIGAVHKLADYQREL